MTYMFKFVLKVNYKWYKWVGKIVENFKGVKQ